MLYGTDTDSYQLEYDLKEERTKRLEQLEDKAKIRAEHEAWYD